MSEEGRAHIREAMNRPEVRAKISTAMQEAMKGNKNRLGIPHSPETRAKIGDAARKYMNQPEIRARNSASQREYMNRPEVRAKHSAAMKGKRINLGHTHSQATRQKMSKSQLAALNRPGVLASRIAGLNRPEVLEKNRTKSMGAKSHFWRGGISFEQYTTTWTRALRLLIRTRDNYMCQICGLPQGEKAFPVHHVNYVKENCDDANLITLCRKCHSATNTHRKYWMRYFQMLIWLKYELLDYPMYSLENITL